MSISYSGKEMFLRNKTICVILFLYLAFQFVSARDWYEISGSYATVEYQTGLETIADSVLKTAELALPRIAEMTGLPLSSFDVKKARIIVTDALDISNGFAIDNTVVIYTVSSAYLTSWTGNQKWYEQVLTHELVHLVTFRKLRRKANIIGTLPFLTIPRWFWEGLAQYFSESWNAYRGDLYIKNAVLDGTLNQNSLYSIEDGRLLYATAHAFVRYLADQYGDSSLVKLLSFNETGLLFKFDHAFEKVYNTSLNNMFYKFIRHITLYYGSRWADFPVSTFVQRFPALPGTPSQVIPIAAADSTYLISSQLKRNHSFESAMIVRIECGEAVILNNLFNDYNTRLIINSKQDRIAYGRIHQGTRDNLHTLSFDWFEYDINKQKSRKIFQDVHARYGTFMSDEQLVIVEIKPYESLLHSINLQTGEKKIIFRTSMPLGRIGSIAESRLIFEAQRNNGNRDLFLLNNSQLNELTNDATDDRKPVFINDSIFIFNRYEDENPALAHYNLNTKRFKLLLSDQYEYWVNEYDKQCKSLIVSHWEPNRQTVFSWMPVESLFTNRYEPLPPGQSYKYSSWISKKSQNDLLNMPDTTLKIHDRKRIIWPHFPLEHAFSFALPLYDKSKGWGIFGLTSWFEALQRQALLGTFLLYPGDLDRSLFFLSHYIRFFNLSFMPFYYHGPVFFSFQNGEYIHMIRDIPSISINKPVNPGGNRRWSFNPSVALAWNRLKVLESDVAHTKVTSYGMIRFGAAGEYHLPTTLYPLLPKRQINIYACLYQSLSRQYDFQVHEFGLKGGTNLLSENIGFKTHLSMLTQKGNLPSLQTVGVDRFFWIDVPRDFGYTRPVRGIKEDLGGNQLLWSSSELVFFISRVTPFKLLFIPIDNLALNVFFDFARVRSNIFQEVHGYGIELTAGNMYFRWGAGYAKGKHSNGERTDQLYFRLAVIIPPHFYFYN